VTSLEAALRQIHVDLIEARVDFALVGGLAVSARTEPRFTRVADLAVAVANDAEAEVLILRLRARGYDVEAIVEQDPVGRLATVNLRVPASLTRRLSTCCSLRPESSRRSSGKPNRLSCCQI
jgi:hypothetical protein